MQTDSEKYNQFINKYSKKYSSTERMNMLLKIINILHKMINLKELDDAKEKCKIKRGANLYAFEFLKQNANKYVKLKDVQEYCNNRNKQETGCPLGDPPRAFEILRKDKLPLEWSEIQYKKIKYVKYMPRLKEKICSKIIDTHKYKKDTFSTPIIEKKLEESNYKCCITGIPQDNGDLAADHFIPKEKGGLSDYNNCIIINKVLNEKKNNNLPIEWFCKTLLTNFIMICKKVGILEECKQKLIKFIQDFNE